MKLKMRLSHTTNNLNLALDKKGAVKFKSIESGLPLA
jgi:hypothetical protein